LLRYIHLYCVKSPSWLCTLIGIHYILQRGGQWAVDGSTTCLSLRVKKKTPHNANAVPPFVTAYLSSCNAIKIKGLGKC